MIINDNHPIQLELKKSESEHSVLLGQKKELHNKRLFSILLIIGSIVLGIAKYYSETYWLYFAMLGVVLGVLLFVTINGLCKKKEKEAMSINSKMSSLRQKWFEYEESFEEKNNLDPNNLNIL